MQIADLSLFDHNFAISFVILLSDLLRLHQAQMSIFSSVKTVDESKSVKIFTYGSLRLAGNCNCCFGLDLDFETQINAF